MLIRFSYVHAHIVNKMVDIVTASARRETGSLSVHEVSCFKEVHFKLLMTSSTAFQDLVFSLIVYTIFCLQTEHCKYYVRDNQIKNFKKL